MFDTLFVKSGLSLDRLRSFCAVADAASVTKAAGGNSTRQSQFSRQIKELEAFFGTELFKRDKKGVALTQAGRKLAQVARKIFAELEDFNADCKAEPQRFSIAAGDALLRWLLLPRISAVHKNLPNVAIDVSTLRTVEIVERINDLRLDFGLIGRDAVSPLHRFESLGFETYGLFVPKRLLLKQKENDWKSLIEKAPLTTIAGTGYFRAALEKAARKNDTSLTFCLTCSTFPQAVMAMQTEQYAAILPTLAEGELPSDRFALVPTPFLKAQTREIYLIWNPRMLEVRPRAADLKELLVGILRLPDKRKH